jgi:multidrug efflux pump subunit AcrB
MPRDLAAITGTTDVSKPVIFGVLTTMATFSIIINIPGPMGALFAPLGYTVIAALLFSIIESQLILPCHLAHRKTERHTGTQPLLDGWLRFQERLSDAMEALANNYYQPAVERVLHWRYVTLAVAVVVLAIAAAFFASGRMVFQFFPSIEGDRLYATLTMPEGTSIEDTALAATHIERAAEQLRQELDAALEEGETSMVSQVFSSIGSVIPKSGILTVEAHSNMAEIGIKLELPPNYSGISTKEFANRWRELTGGIPDAVELVFTAEKFGLGAAIEFELYGSDFDELRSAATDLGNALRAYNGIHDVSDSYRSGKQEVQLKLLPNAKYLGVTLDDLGQQVRQAFYGYEVQRIQRGKEDIRVMVRYPEKERRSLGDLEDMRIRTTDGIEIPFSAVARADLSRGYTAIKRVDGQRVVSVRADVNRTIVAPETVIKLVKQGELPAILARHPSVNYKMAGEAEEYAESLGGLMSTTMLVLLLIYLLLAIPLMSYLQPLVIMSVIPFGMIGAVIGHYILGLDLVFFSLLGIVALAGVVVNSSLVLVDYINQQREFEPDLFSVVSHAGSVRFRPIVSSFVPMATSLAFGVLFGTVITLFLVPCLYMVLEDFLNFSGLNKSSDFNDSRCGGRSKLQV